ncbi:MAG: sulfatase-like hydrolase/transferase [Cyclobacteriaceae bacterium]
MPFLLLVLGMCVQCEPKEDIAKRPNVIFILTDDLGAGDLGVTGHPYAQTPNIDKLANEGIRFTKAYMSAAWCAPSRYALMRGLHPAREFYESYDLDPAQPSITSILQKSGYATAHIGKWHLANNTVDSPAPAAFGIDVPITTSSPKAAWSGKESQTKEFRANSTERYVDLAIDFIEENHEKPFYINLWVQPTHSYIDPSDEQLRVYDGLKVDLKDFKNPQQRQFLEFVSQYGDINESMQAYCADLTALDTALGRLFSFLKMAGIDQNTIVVFSSDNGPGPLTSQVKNQSVAGRYRERPTLLNSVGSAGEFGERKLSVKDGGTRVPFIVRWPAQISEGSVDNKTVLSGLDWLPTIAALTNTELPPETGFDGQDMSRAFTGSPVDRNSPLLWYESNGHSAVLVDQWKGTITDGNFHLYNIENDPGEVADLKNIENQKAREVEDILRAWMAQVPVPKAKVVRKK